MAKHITVEHIDESRAFVAGITREELVEKLTQMGA